MTKATWQFRDANVGGKIVGPADIYMEAPRVTMGQIEGILHHDLLGGGTIYGLPDGSVVGWICIKTSDGFVMIGVD